MNINATLFGQMITFILFVWFTMKYVWPPIMKALEERQAKIADGLSAAERGQRELELAQEKVIEQLRAVKQQAAEIVDKANKRATQIIEESKEQAKVEGRRQLELAQEDIQQHITSAKNELRKNVVSLAMTGAERILGREVDKNESAKLIEDLVGEL